MVSVARMLFIFIFQLPLRPSQTCPAPPLGVATHRNPGLDRSIYPLVFYIKESTKVYSNILKKFDVKFIFSSLLTQDQALFLHSTKSIEITTEVQWKLFLFAYLRMSLVFVLFTCLQLHSKTVMVSISCSVLLWFCHKKNQHFKIKTVTSSEYIFKNLSLKLFFHH